MRRQNLRLGVAGAAGGEEAGVSSSGLEKKGKF